MTWKDRVWFLAFILLILAMISLDWHKPIWLTIWSVLVGLVIWAWVVVEKADGDSKEIQ